MPSDAEIVKGIIRDLRDSALRIEISTIPLYLYAMYSIKPKTLGITARTAIREVVVQEMLHLSLVGNIMSALGADPTPQLYSDQVVPSYPDDISYNFVEMNLQAANRDTLRTFVRIEAPLPAAHIARTDKSTAPQWSKGQVAPEYQTIGDLYMKLVHAIQSLSNNPKLFGNKAKQFTNFGKSVILITDKESAIQGLKLVMDQGEGGGAVDEEFSHYATFKNLLDTFRSTPWELYNVPKNPETTDYPAGSYIRRLSLAFDAAYCYLLQTIDNVWKTENADDHAQLMKIIGGIMKDVLPPLASILVLQPFRHGCAAPCFNYYPKGGSPLTPAELHRAILRELADAITLVPADEVISITVGQYAKAAGEAAIAGTTSDDGALRGAVAIRAGIAAIQAPSVDNAAKAVGDATTAGLLESGAKTAADEAQLFLDQRARLADIHKTVIQKLMPPI